MRSRSFAGSSFLGLASRTLTDSSKIELVSAREVNALELQRFYKTAFPRRAEYLAAHWAWHYGGPEGENLSDWPLVAIVPSGQIVGHVGTIPSICKRESTTIQAAWFVDFFVSPHVRGSGVGGRLIRRVMKAAPLMMAIAVSEYSLPIFRKYGWREIPGTIRLSTVLSFKQFTSAHHSPLRKISFPMLDGPVGYLRTWLLSRGRAYDAACDTKELDKSESLDCSMLGVDHNIWNSELIRWRLQNSQVGGRIFLHTAGDECALTRVLSNFNRRELHVLSFGQTTSTLIFKYLLRWAIEHKVSRVVMVTGDSELKRMARKMLFVGTPMTPFLYSADETLLEGVSDFPPRFQMIDSDLDMAISDDSLS